ncbi:MAG: glycosyltransferase [Treponema sp.]|nr:glycosyltransferase [Treponema sp.]
MSGLFREWLRDKNALSAKKTGKNGITASLIIPVRNESLRINCLLQSLSAQDYPVEIIFVDDCSDDESPIILAGYAREAAERGLNCRIVTLTENPGPNHKQYALSAGIAEAQGDILIFTDSDCELPAGWIRAMASRMSDETVGAVIGPVFKKKQGKGFLSLYQCYDHAVRYIYLAGSAGLGAAGGGFGNNLIVRKAALDTIGGYDAVPPSPTEDAALISRIRSRSKYHIRAIVLPDAAVETAAENTWSDFIEQTLRWNNGGLFSHEPITRLNYNFLMLMTSAGILALPLVPFLPGLWPMPAGVFTVMVINTIASFILFRQNLPSGGFLNLGYLLSLLFTPLYFTLMTVMSYCRVKTKWKGKAVIQ